jgi:tagatose 1,6-diphosphate aldolase
VTPQPGIPHRPSAAAPASSAAAAVGRRRRLLRLGGSRGVIAGVAIDHRDSLRVVLERRGITGTSAADLRALKLGLTRVLAPAATAIMLDAELGGLALESGVVPASVALIMPLEAQGYEMTGTGPTTTLLEDFSPVVALRYGADACKLLLPFRIDDPVTTARQEALVIATAATCHDLGLPLVVEPVVYQRPSEAPEAYAGAYGRLVLGAVERLQPLGADLLKLPFPVLDLAATTESAALDACSAIAAACRDTPWVLLGAGVDTDTFVAQIRIAGTAGAAGFLAGRGIWAAALTAGPGDTERVAAAVCRPALERCREVAERFARPLASGPVGPASPGALAAT